MTNRKIDKTMLSDLLNLLSTNSIAMKLPDADFAKELSNVAISQAQEGVYWNPSDPVFYPSSGDCNYAFCPEVTFYDHEKETYQQAMPMLLFSSALPPMLLFSSALPEGMKVIDLETFLEMEKEAEASKDIR